MGDRSLLPIGRFARACRLSIKALRHYDELGLLAPARVDASGYRFYARAQVRTAIAISLLRSLDVPLDAIAHIAFAPPGNAGAMTALAAQRARIERDLARSRQALSCVDRIMREGEVMPHAVMVRQEPSLHVVSIEATTRPELHVEAGFALFERLRALLSEQGVPLRAPLVCLLPDPPDDDTMLLQLCAKVPAGCVVPGTTSMTLKACRLAYATHRGPYQEIGIAHHTVLAWVHEHGEHPSGPMREIYVDDPEVVAQEQVRTEIGVPL